MSVSIYAVHAAAFACYAEANSARRQHPQTSLSRHRLARKIREAAEESLKLAQAFEAEARAEYKSELDAWGKS